MIVDTSALVVVLDEPGCGGVLAKLATPGRKGIAAPTLVETGILLAARLGQDPYPLLVRLLEALDVSEVPFGDAHWRAALRAFLRFGRGRHPAALNYGDCMAYAVARLAGEPLLFVGDDFTKTDIDGSHRSLA